MAVTYESIASTTVTGSAQASVSFNSISGSYTDLIVVVNASVTTGNNDIAVNVNSDTGANYSRTVLFGDGSTANSVRSVNQTTILVPQFQSTDGAGNAIIQFMNYSNTTTYKTFLARGNQALASGLASAQVNLWRSTAAITSITLAANTTTWKVGSTFALYGIKAA